MQPRGLPLWLRRARELVEGLQSASANASASGSSSASASTQQTPFRPPPWLRPPWDRVDDSQQDSAPAWRPPPRPTRPLQAQPPSAPASSSSPLAAAKPPSPNPGPHTLKPPTTQPPPRQTDPFPLSVSESQAGQRMRDVLRNVAQPVVIAVTSQGDTFHGATLTSFASLTLQPHPLVAFSLRLPSRLADCLRPPPPETQYECAPGTMCSPPAQPTRLTISLLSGVNEPVAEALARPGHESIFDGASWERRGGLPALTDAVGGLLCQVVHTVPLRDVGGDTSSGNAGSELFVCRVLDAWKGVGEDSLVHYQREYGCVRGKGE